MRVCLTHARDWGRAGQPDGDSVGGASAVSVQGELQRPHALARRSEARRSGQQALRSHPQVRAVREPRRAHPPRRCWSCRVRVRSASARCVGAGGREVRPDSTSLCRQVDSAPPTFVISCSRAEKASGPFLAFLR
eukprot:3888391-Rhodomonas_salina.1